MEILLQMETPPLQTTLNLLSLVRRQMLHDEEIEERGFVCELDRGSSLDDCGDPVTGVNPFTGTEEFMNLDPGEHTFTVTDFYCC